VLRALDRDAKALQKVVQNALSACYVGAVPTRRLASASGVLKVPFLGCVHWGVMTMGATNQILFIFDEFSPPVPLLILLAEEGYEVILARNEEEVDELATESKPGLILLELQSNAIDMLQLIQSAQPRIPVILMAEPSLLNLALEIKQEFGALEALLKPVDFRVLRELVQQALGGSPKAA